MRKMLFQHVKTKHFCHGRIAKQTICHIDAELHKLYDFSQLAMAHKWLQEYLHKKKNLCNGVLHFESKRRRERKMLSC